MSFRKNAVLAIDIGSTALRVAELYINKGAITLGTHGKLAIHLEEESEQSKESNEAIISAGLEKLLSELRITGKKVQHSIISIPGKQIGIKQINTAKLTDEELTSSLLFEARKHLPLKGEEVLLDYQTIRENSDSLDILLSVTSRETVEMLHRVLHHSHIKPDVVDAPPLAMINAVLFAEKDAAKDLILLHIGATATQVVVLSKAGDLHTREVAIGGNHFTDEIRKEEQLSFEEAEALKLEKGVIPDDDTSANSEAQSSGLSLSLALESKGMNKAVEALTRELQRSIRFFIKEASIEAVDQIYISGGVAVDSTLRSHLEKELRLKISLFDPFTENDISNKIPTQEHSQYCQLLGMGLRRLHELFPNKLK